MTGAVHAHLSDPSAWVVRWAERIPAGGDVLDVACGGGRHARLLAGLGHRVVAVDREPLIREWLAGVAAEIVVADLEQGPWPFADRRFDGVVVTNYLWRPLFPALLEVIAPGGVLIYETFAVGNERFGRPSNPEFLLRPGELLDLVRGCGRVLGYEDDYVDRPKPALVQRICLRRE